MTALQSSFQLDVDLIDTMYITRTKQKHSNFITGNETLGGYTVEVISKNVVESGPEKCPFETRHMLTTEKLSGKRYFNI